MALDPTVFIHDKALVESESIGAGTRIWAFAHVLEGSVIGADCNICDHVYIEGGVSVGDRVTIKNNVMLWDKVTIEDEVFLGPNAVLTNDMNPRSAFRKSPDQFLPTLIKRGASIGANATILCGLTVGEQAFVGAGAIIIRDVPAYALMVGNPARQIGWMCACGLKLTDALECSCGRAYQMVSKDAGLQPK